MRKTLASRISGIKSNQKSKDNTGIPGLNYTDDDGNSKTTVKNTKQGIIPVYNVCVDNSIWKYHMTGTLPW